MPRAWPLRLISKAVRQSARGKVPAIGTFPARRRVVLGSNAHQAITAALRERLADIEAQRERAYRTDGDDIIAART